MIAVDTVTPVVGADARWVRVARWLRKSFPLFFALATVSRMSIRVNWC